MLSSNTLFHYTETREALLSILENTFWASFCLEDAPFEEGGNPLQNGTPMVCFCDIPLSGAAAHMGQYGRYMIGLTKEWGVSNGVSPVLYTHAASPVSTGLKRLMNNGLQIGKGPIRDEVWDEVARILAFTKAYEQTVGSDRTETIRFYDEREWRWVPQTLPDDIRFGIDASQFRGGVPAEGPARRLRDACRLSFEPSDIRYIVVESDEEILETVKEIRRIEKRYSEDEKTLLVTRVMSARQIVEDF